MPLISLGYYLRYFGLIEFFENKSDVVVFGCFSNRESILNSLEVVYWGDDICLEKEKLQ